MRGAHTYSLWEWHPCHDSPLFAETIATGRVRPSQASMFAPALG